jgi:hypothetical protein
MSVERLKQGAFWVLLSCEAMIWGAKLARQVTDAGLAQAPVA